MKKPFFSIQQSNNSSLLVSRIEIKGNTGKALTIFCPYLALK